MAKERLKRGFFIAPVFSSVFSGVTLKHIELFVIRAPSPIHEAQPIYREKIKAVVVTPNGSSSLTIKLEEGKAKSSSAK